MSESLRERIASIIKDVEEISVSLERGMVLNRNKYVDAIMREVEAEVELVAREMQDDIDALKADRANLVEALADYAVHHMECPLSQWSQGRPTPDGHYETMYAGKWYRDDDKPPCTCGLDAALAAAKGVKK